jgi:hypothetical protein
MDSDESESFVMSGLETSWISRILTSGGFKYGEALRRCFFGEAMFLLADFAEHERIAESTSMTHDMIYVCAYSICIHHQCLHTLIDI